MRPVQACRASNMDEHATRSMRRISLPHGNMYPSTQPRVPSPSSSSHAAAPCNASASLTGKHPELFATLITDQ